MKYRPHNFTKKGSIQIRQGISHTTDLGNDHLQHFTRSQSCMQYIFLQHVMKACLKAVSGYYHAVYVNLS